MDQLERAPKTESGSGVTSSMMPILVPEERRARAGIGEDAALERSGLYGRIAVAIDGSACSGRALTEAIKFARCEGAELTILHVMVVSSALYSVDVRQPIERGENEERERGERLVAAALAEAEKLGVQAKVALVEAMDSAVNGITDYMAEHDVNLIIVGTRGLTGIKRFFTGSVATGVVRCAPCSVLVVK